MLIDAEPVEQRQKTKTSQALSNTSADNPNPSGSSSATSPVSVTSLCSLLFKAGTTSREDKDKNKIVQNAE